MKFYLEHRARGNVFKWDGEAWCWMCGALDLDPSVIKSPLVGFDAIQTAGTGT